MCSASNHEIGRRAGVSAALFWLLSALAAPAAGDTWVFDRIASEVRFTYDHFGLSRQSGRFRDIEGRLEFTPTDPTGGEVDVQIRAASVSTGVPELDQVLRSPDFLDVARHPFIRFRSTQVRQRSDRTGDVLGELTLLGLTRPVSLAVRWNYTGEYPLSSINPTYAGKWVSGFSARTVIERSHWGMKRGIPLLSDEVEIVIEVELLKVD